MHGVIVTSLKNPKNRDTKKGYRARNCSPRHPAYSIPPPTPLTVNTIFLIVQTSSHHETKKIPGVHTIGASRTRVQKSKHASRTRCHADMQGLKCAVNFSGYIDYASCSSGSGGESGGRLQRIPGWPALYSPPGASGSVALDFRLSLLSALAFPSHREIERDFLFVTRAARAYDVCAGMYRLMPVYRACSRVLFVMRWPPGAGGRYKFNRMRAFYYIGRDVLYGGISAWHCDD